MADFSSSKSLGIKSRVARVPVVGRALNRLLEVPSPFYHRNSPAEGITQRLLDEAFAKDPDARVVNIGSRTRLHPRMINLDIEQSGNADVVADAAAMPFDSNSVDLIINIAVIEHVSAPHRVAAECCRVLKPGGKIYCSIPFFQMYHPDPIDVQRYTIAGIAILFDGLKEEETGVELGPASAVSLTMREFLAILFSFNSSLLYHLLQVVFGYVTWPIKFLDYFLARHKFAYMIACSVYFVGQKPSENRDSQVLSDSGGNRILVPAGGPKDERIAAGSAAS